MRKSYEYRALQQYFFEEVCVKRETYPTFTDMESLAEDLQEQGIHIGIATTDSLESAVDCVKKIGLRPYLSFYGTSGIGMPEKPDGELIACAADHWKIEADEIAVVGDTPNDMRFAKNGGAYAIGVLIFRETVSLPVVLGIVLILIGCVVLNLG